MGFELEMHRRITDSNADNLPGDTRLVEHPWFRLVSDKVTIGGQQISNLEFVTEHFDQYTVSAVAAQNALDDRIRALRSTRDLLYGATGRLDALLANHAPENMAIQFVKNGGTAIAGPCPGVDDNRLLVHYSVGFPPSQWRQMLGGIHTVIRDDSARNRAKTHLTNALAAADTLVHANAATINNAAAGTELRGHIALLYMHAAVWVDRTLNLALRDVRKERPINQNKIDNVDNQQPYGTKVPKNKIAALPRAMLCELHELLSDPAKQFLADEKEAVLNAIATKLEQQHGLDLPEGYVLESDEHGEASLGDFLGAGFGSNNEYSQQILFGGMKEVGIDRAQMARPVIPFEIRQIYASRVTWDEFSQQAARVLAWSRNPGANAL
ncbi:hypothetical protein [Actinorhabdospora filicis]|nr:hypothetical protein [Actinorhabdospora filicis]